MHKIDDERKKNIDRVIELEHKFYKGQWEHKDGEEYAYLVTGNYMIWLTPESFLSY
ncbi:hypothetical protein RQV66_000509 [Vibrio alginolyticus]|uniref:hypothetical protein n=1 Tax=Vibrio alginolyticus TaxID=663 RepID=UPI00215C3E03|nr:hypothetical protein [Vibrio alginolyticus]ELI1832715.1 hypothetical protein [Vibrio alginolyticus]MCR9441350.1 hypothetical protein [Vibrio alginolyticus]MCS0133642.1 hypothetical protein [Vibrio alginolyticus]